MTSDNHKDVRPSVESDHESDDEYYDRAEASEHTEFERDKHEDTRDNSVLSDRTDDTHDQAATEDSYLGDPEYADTNNQADDGGDASSHHDATDEDVFSDKSPRSSLGSYDAVSESGKATATRSSRLSDVPQYDREYEKGDFIPTVRGMPRPSFRASSDVRAMPMSSPPSSVLGSPRSTKKKFPTVSRLGTPTASAQYSPKRMSTPSCFKGRKEAPLVLLHVTLLPLRWPWGSLLNNIDADDVSESVKSLRESWRLLQDRIGDTVIERGILLGHPQNDYEVLEERLLEALELPFRRRARILECGHYLGPANESTLTEDEESEDEWSNQRSRAGDRRHWCNACKSEIRGDSLGSSKIFRVKVYASNGLMRAGAWEACWKEMERVDVELEPIVGPTLQEELVRLAAAHPEAVMDKEGQREQEDPQPEACRVGTRDEERLDESSPKSSGTAQASKQEGSQHQNASFFELLLQSVGGLLQDRRNVAIFTLCIFVLMLAFRNAPTPAEPVYEPVIHRMRDVPVVRRAQSIDTSQVPTVQLSPTDSFVAPPPICDESFMTPQQHAPLADPAADLELPPHEDVSITEPSELAPAEEPEIEPITLDSASVSSDHTAKPEPSAAEPDFEPALEEDVPVSEPTETSVSDQEEPAAEEYQQEATQDEAELASTTHEEAPEIAIKSTTTQDGTATPMSISTVYAPCSTFSGAYDQFEYMALQSEQTETVTEKKVVRVFQTVTETEVETATETVKPSTTEVSVEAIPSVELVEPVKGLSEGPSEELSEQLSEQLSGEPSDKESLEDLISVAPPELGEPSMTEAVVEAGDTDL
ncbi:hypothetical protein F5Y11DRAFT_300097 [Daldinia sp. FL1419]|nr:hypothetical protein F5Y11DRAFT_300097 [Daldinia sp. FL1419]